MDSLQPNKKKEKSEPLLFEHHPVRRLLLFQLKLALDALRDILLSPVSIVATLLDLAQKKHGKNSHFEIMLKLGRESERRINLFDQNRASKQSKTVDSVLKQVEDILVKEYKEGGISEKARSALEKSLKIKASKSVNLDKMK
ncbi:hypothetical protein [Aliikangiella sp. G2MR2-5]|uniref:hypothetical protein n=1 Tax=Aliikangiella sp. G2MR2-5 TaxID=2788943 RepID=UPI0018A93727|nr:hypothetical protein [Aliikangiella sp. G2MR2-5]